MVVRGCVHENDGRRDSRAMVRKEGPGGGPREAIPGGVMAHGWSARVRAYRALATFSQRGASKVGESAPVVVEVKR
jgi:hypothetical protein